MLLQKQKLSQKINTLFYKCFLCFTYKLSFFCKQNRHKHDKKKRKNNAFCLKITLITFLIYDQLSLQSLLKEITLQNIN